MTIPAINTESRNRLVFGIVVATSANHAAYSKTTTARVAIMPRIRRGKLTTAPSRRPLRKNHAQNDSCACWFAPLIPSSTLRPNRGEFHDCVREESLVSDRVAAGGQETATGDHPDTPSPRHPLLWNWTGCTPAGTPTLELAIRRVCRATRPDCTLPRKGDTFLPGLRGQCSRELPEANGAV